jgi:hypothetical protein
MNADGFTASHTVFPDDTRHTLVASILLLYHHMCSYRLDPSYNIGVARYL